MIRAFAFHSLRQSFRRPRPVSFLLVSRQAHSKPQEESDIDGAAPLLRFVSQKVAECAKLRSEFTEDMSSKEDILRAQKIKELEPLIEAWEQWDRYTKLRKDLEPLCADPDEALRGMAIQEYRECTETLLCLAKDEFPRLIIPPSKTAHLSALMELKAGVGGSEANLFLGDVMRMYLRLSQSLKWKATVVTSLETNEGGVKTAILEVKGGGAYDALRWESGVHRVQRVPATEASGRVHTSTVAVVVLPLVEESDRRANEELFSNEDVKIEVMRARGAGGQHVNKTESAVRLTHIPTGITVSMQDERSQHQNRRRAFQVLSARLMDLKFTKEMAERRAVRQNLVKTADRSEKIRTYNYAQDRVTDHRLGLSVKNLENVMEGEGMIDIIEHLKRDYHETVMKDVLEN